MCNLQMMQLGMCTQHHFQNMFLLHLHFHFANNSRVARLAVGDCLNHELVTMSARILTNLYKRDNDYPESLVIAETLRHREVIERCATAQAKLEPKACNGI